MATRGWRIFPAKALPRMMSCTSGKIMDASMSAGERKNLRISRSTMAIILFIKSTPRDSRLQPRPLRHGEGVCFLKLVAQLPACVMYEDIVQGCVLYRERLHRNPCLDSHLYQFGCSARAVAGQDA